MSNIVSTTPKLSAGARKTNDRDRKLRSALLAMTTAVQQSWWMVEVGRMSSAFKSSGVGQVFAPCAKIGSICDFSARPRLR